MEELSVKYKLPKLEMELQNAPLLLRMMLRDADQYAQTHFGKALTITRILGKIEGDSGVHSDYRGADCRNQYCGVFTFSHDEAKEISDYINDMYERNDGYKSCIHHGFQGGPYHFHFQIAVSTKAYMKKDD